MNIAIAMSGERSLHSHGLGRPWGPALPLGAASAPVGGSLQKRSVLIVRRCRLQPGQMTVFQGRSCGGAGRGWCPAGAAQDFEGVTPNLLARSMETVEGGGIVVVLLSTMASLRDLYSLTMDVHKRLQTPSHQTITGLRPPAAPPPPPLPPPPGGPPPHL